MKPQELFNILLKMLGIFLIKDLLFGLFDILNLLTSLLQVNRDIAFFQMVVTLLFWGLNAALVYLLIFRTDDTINKLKLTTGLREDLSFNLHRSVLLSMAIIIAGMATIALALPPTIKFLYLWFQYIEMKNRNLPIPNFDYPTLFAYIGQLVIGFIFLTQKQVILNFIELRRKDKN